MMHDHPITKQCLTCKKFKTLEEYYWAGPDNRYHNKKYPSSYCSECHRAKRREWYKNSDSNKRKVRASELRTKFGITIEEYEELAAYQQHVCAICEEPCSRGISLAVDHCHKTGKIRGLLCCRCNRVLGQMNDSPNLLRRAADYLEE